MNEEQSLNGSPAKKETRSSTSESLTFVSDELFFQSLFGFIEHEKLHLRSPEAGNDERRLILSRSVFDQVIGRAATYRNLLLTIKNEYENAIRELKRGQDKARATQQTVALISCQESQVNCQRWANQLRDRISDLQRETSKLQEVIKKQKSANEQSTWITGLTVAESDDPEALDTHLQHLKAKRATLLDRKSLCVSLEVKAELDAKLQNAKSLRERLSTENSQLKVLLKRLRLVFQSLSSCREGDVPRLTVLGSTLENFRQTCITDNGSRSFNTELFEEEEPSGVDESEFLMDYLDRFVGLFDLRQYEDAALIAASCPGGVLRSLHIAQMFRAVRDFTGLDSPLLLLFWALLITIPAGVALPAPLSLLYVSLALKCDALQMVTYRTKHLGDILTEHAHSNPTTAHLCLALATNIYEACKLDKKTALSMCRRGLIHSAAEFMKNCRNFTADDCMWVLCRSPRLSLLQVLTQPQGRSHVSCLSVGGACFTLLGDHQQRDLALQLLDSFISQGPGVLQDAILEDANASVEVWINVASMCSEMKRADLSQAILSILLDQGRTRILSPDSEGVQLMEHIFW